MNQSKQKEFAAVFAALGLVFAFFGEATAFAVFSVGAGLMLK